MSANEIIERLTDKTWKDSTIHLLLNGLLEKGIIYVDGISRSGRTYARHFNTSITMEEYHSEQIKNDMSYHQSKKTKLPGIFASLIDDDDISDETLSELESLIEKRRKELGK